MSELERVAGFYEVSLIGQFRAGGREQAKMFAQLLANDLERLGVLDVGWDVRQGSASEFDDSEARVSLGDQVPKEIFPESVPHEEVQRQLKEHRRGDNDE